jgi:hypothetical protein
MFDLYDHASIPATLAKRFGLSPLTARDQAANSLGGCLTRTQPRLSAAEAPLKSDPVSWDTELARMTVTKEAGHGDEAEEAGAAAGAVQYAERD